MRSNILSIFRLDCHKCFMSASRCHKYRLLRMLFRNTLLYDIKTTKHAYDISISISILPVIVFNIVFVQTITNTYLKLNNKFSNCFIILISIQSKQPEKIFTRALILYLRK